MPTATAMPRWDMTPFFPSIDSPEVDRALEQFKLDIDRLEGLFKELGIEDAELPELPEGAFDVAIEAFNALLREGKRLGAYIACVQSTDTRDPIAQAKQSLFDQQSSRITKLGTQLTAWIGMLDVDGLIGA